MNLTSVFAVVSEQFGDLVANIAIWDLDIILGGAIIRHEREETIVGDVELQQHQSVWVPLQ
jgi:hypothetical protein